MASKRRLRRKQCENKKRYEDQGSARMDIGRLKRKDPTALFNVWKCPHCGGYHVGHRRIKRSYRGER